MDYKPYKEPKTCSYCFGKGKVEVWGNATCDMCGGNGRHHGVSGQCACCGGSGKVFASWFEICSHCGGSGMS